LKQSVLKTDVPGRVPGVRIPLPPPRSLGCREIGLRPWENRCNSPQFCDFRNLSGPEKMHCLVEITTFMTLFSEGQKGSAVSTIREDES